ncbi:MAG: hypothetical protein DKM50_00865 [Candidatus Margulisiibacteriota bacterium]|nr:MAG: hypothetical protein A2X43_05340 [Candidatus Margulisbacteria bacterium GWD2_39_127]OGI03433.1 MAG: hypothetical protein A2X42_05135 [Candidatus Margulisbacteria bacterium GWF2_38_17]OGI05622.1 MAG: hypothetical protein A2X41_06035 [Candidatus Margulisbacteria bacterium GWE2_39_32]PZM83967.1 MAG: hypothetical protein DKM50_00865 [Candidatus Margulisiibacteriota bacterium]HAR64465.1 hypothetical protein [Candidatus Margulisiibacteriota bacterium]
MAKIEIHSIPGVMSSVHHVGDYATVDTWSNFYGASLEAFKGLIDAHIAFTKKQKVLAVVVDSTYATGVMPNAVQKFIQDEVFLRFSKSGIKFFINIKAKSSLTKLAVDSFSVNAGPAGITLGEFADVDSAIAWLKKNS